MNGEQLIARDVCYRYPGAESLAVDHCSLTLTRGTVTALTGLTASGKTTLGLILKGLIKPDIGEILLEEEGMNAMDSCLRRNDRGDGMNALDSCLRRNDRGEGMNALDSCLRRNDRGEGMNAMDSCLRRNDRGDGMNAMDSCLRRNDRGDGMNPPDSGKADTPTPPEKRCVQCSGYSSSRQAIPISDSRENLSPTKLNQIVGWVGAHPEIQIFAPTVRDEIGFGLKHRGLGGAELESRIARALDVVGLDPAEHLDRNPFSLSGGKRRLIALASITCIDYDWFIFDEPTAGLDLHGFRAVTRLVRSLADGSKGVCIISHDDIFLGGVTDERVVMDGGKV